ncbi:pilin [Patescibacteria group bacterium]|jgi:hypothetical protein|nr:pilin [Patescibacteria group bacterium]
MKHLFKKAILTGMTTGLMALPLLAGAQAPNLNENPFVRGQKDANTIATKAQIGGGETDLYVIVGRIINVVLGFLGIVLLFYFLYGGFKWMTSGGDEDGVSEAKTMIRNAVIGLVIVMASYALSDFVLRQLVAVTS